MSDQIPQAYTFQPSEKVTWNPEEKKGVNHPSIYQGDGEFMITEVRDAPDPILNRHAQLVKIRLAAEPDLELSGVMLVPVGS